MCYSRGKPMTITIRMTEEQRKLADSYAKCKGVTLSQAIKDAFFETIEDEFDVAEAEMALAEHEKNPKTISFEELSKEFGL